MSPAVKKKVAKEDTKLKPNEKPKGKVRPGACLLENSEGICRKPFFYVRFNLWG